MLCDSLDGWDGAGGGREVQEGGDMCIPRRLGWGRRWEGGSGGRGHVYTYG